MISTFQRLGILGGRVSETRRFAQGDIRRTSRRFAPDQLALLGPLIECLTSLARECGFTLSQLAIAWVLSHREVSHVLLGARQPQQIRENAARIDAVISDDVVSEINRLVKTYKAQLPPLF